MCFPRECRVLFFSAIFIFHFVLDDVPAVCTSLSDIREEGDKFVPVINPFTIRLFRHFVPRKNNVGTNEKYRNSPINRAFRMFCPHLSPLRVSFIGVILFFTTPLIIDDRGDKWGQMNIKCLFYGHLELFSFVPSLFFQGTNDRKAPFYGHLKGDKICPRIFSPCFWACAKCKIFSVFCA